jgi:hypothetical protein
MSDVYAWRDPFMEVAEARARQQLAERERDELKQMRGWDLTPAGREVFAAYLRDALRSMADREANRVVYERMKHATDALTASQASDRIERERMRMFRHAEAISFAIGNAVTITLTPRLSTYAVTLEIGSIGPIKAAYEIDWREIEMGARRR